MADTCSFCGAERDEVEFLFDSDNGAMICDECVMNCVNVMIYGPEAVMEIEIDCEDLELDPEEKDAEIQSNSGC